LLSSKATLHQLKALSRHLKATPMALKAIISEDWLLFAVILLLPLDGKCFFWQEKDVFPAIKTCSW
jgi:hypothetical protein